MSTIASIFNFLIELLRWFSDLFDRKESGKAATWMEIEAKRNALALALADGRVSDVAILRKELEVLMEKYLRGVRSDERRMHRDRNTRQRNGFSFLLASLVLSLFLSGCWSNKPTTVFVTGERINLVKPGTTVEVPELMPPAKQWYLLDNIAIQHWLGIPVEFDMQATEKPGIAMVRNYWKQPVAITQEGDIRKETYISCDGKEKRVEVNGPGWRSVTSYSLVNGVWVEAVPL